MQIERLIKARILDPTDFPLYVFPIFFFSKSLYKDWKVSVNGLFIGNITNGQFDISLTSKVFSTKEWLPLAARGKIEDYNIEIQYIIPTYIILIVASLLLIDLILITSNNRFDNYLYLITVIIVIRYFYKIYRLINIFNGICN